MANESNLKQGKEKRQRNRDIVRQAGGLAASYFVSRYLARIIPVCRLGKSVGRYQDGLERENFRRRDVFSREQHTASIDLVLHA